MLYCKRVHVTFLAAKKVTKEGGLRALRKCAPLRIPRRSSIRHPKMFRFSDVYRENIFRFLSGRCSKIGTFLDTGWRCARRGFFRGGAPRSEFIITMLAGGKHTTLSLAFSECPLKSPSFGTFLGDQEKYTTVVFDYRNAYLFDA